MYYISTNAFTDVSMTGMCCNVHCMTAVFAPSHYVRYCILTSLLFVIPHTCNFNLNSFSKHHKGSGFIANLAVDGQEKVLLMTCHHVLPSLPEAQESDIYFGRTSDDDVNSTQHTGTVISGEELFDSRYFKTDTVEVRKPASTDCL